MGWFEVIIIEVRLLGNYNRHEPTPLWFDLFGDIEIWFVCFSK